MSQNESPIVVRSWGERERVAETAIGALPIALLVLCAILVQARLGANADVHWLTDLAGRWLDGQTPYVDFIENNPPASIILYVFPTALARALHLRPDVVTQACVFFAAIVEFAIAAAVARGAGLTREFGSAGLFWSAAAILLLPGFTFSQRDHLALVFALPIFVVLPARALFLPIETHLAIAGGLGAGCMICLRPHYALALAPAAIYALYWRGWRGAACIPEILSCALLVVAYASSIFFFFPHFVSDTAPMNLAVHVHGRAPIGWLLSQSWLLVWLSLALALWGTRSACIASLPSQFLGLASLGALASYLFQGKGWSYHLYVADALILTSYVIANRASLRLKGLPALTLATVLAAVSGLLVTAFLVRGELLFVTMQYLLLPALIILSARLALYSPDDARPGSSLRWTRLGVAAVALAAGEMAMLEGLHPPYFTAEMAEFASRPKIALVSGKGSDGIDLANQTNAIYASRAYAMDISETAADRLRRGGLATETEVALRRYISEDHDRLAATVRDDRPDAIVVDPDWARVYLEPAFLRDLLENYRLRATTKLPARFKSTSTLQLFTREATP